ncbi:MAG: response regulator [Bacteroidetes bacterium]|nr:response regulator [Bacteroidota bacterium]
MEPGERARRSVQQRADDAIPKKTGLLISQNQEEALDLEFHLSTQLGLSIIISSSVNEAQQILKKTSIDIVLLDVQMEHANPLTMCKFIKSDEQLWNIPVVALLGERDLSNRNHALNYGADDFIMRPFDYSEIYSRTRAQLRLRELYLQLLENERIKVLFEMAGAAAHELAQPVTGAMGLIQIILDKTEKSKDLNQVDKELELLYECLQRVSDVIHKIQRIRKYETTAYAGASQIIDINKASESSAK